MQAEVTSTASVWSTEQLRQNGNGVRWVGESKLTDPIWRGRSGQLAVEHLCQTGAYRTGRSSASLQTSLSPSAGHSNLRSRRRAARKRTSPPQQPTGLLLYIAADSDQPHGVRVSRCIGCSARQPPQQSRDRLCSAVSRPSCTAYIGPRGTPSLQG
eukprot:COSAG02_NODE_2995_length_7582_cov_12.315916_5_plen_156_part_00